MCWAGHITCLCPAAANTTTLELSQKSDDGKQQCRGGGEGLAAPRLGGHSRNFAAARSKKMDLTRVEISNGLQVGTSCHCAGHREERRVLLLVNGFSLCTAAAAWLLQQFWWQLAANVKVPSALALPS